VVTKGGKIVNDFIHFIFRSIRRVPWTNLTI